MFSPSRDQVRQFFCAAWKKYQERLPLVGAEVTAADSAGALEKEWTPEGGQMNPFLHLSLHLAIHEQVSIDQPPGIRAAFNRLRAKMEAHAAEHVLLECLGETIWRAQRTGGPMDAAAYLDQINRSASQS